MIKLFKKCFKYLSLNYNLRVEWYDYKNKKGAYKGLDLFKSVMLLGERVDIIHRQINAL